MLCTGKAQFVARKLLRTLRIRAGPTRPDGPVCPPTRAWGQFVPQSNSEPLSIAFRYKSVELFLGRYIFCISLYCAFVRLLCFFDPRRNAARPRPDARYPRSRWLRMKDVAAASELLKPFDARLMRCFAVSNRINHVANDDEE